MMTILVTCYTFYTMTMKFFIRSCADNKCYCWLLVRDSSMNEKSPSTIFGKSVINSNWKFSAFEKLCSPFKIASKELVKKASLSLFTLEISIEVIALFTFWGIFSVTPTEWSGLLSIISIILWISEAVIVALCASMALTMFLQSNTFPTIDSLSNNSASIHAYCNLEPEIIFPIVWICANIAWSSESLRIYCRFIFPLHLWVCGIYHTVPGQMTQLQVYLGHTTIYWFLGLSLRQYKLHLVNLMVLDAMVCFTCW